MTAPAIQIYRWSREEYERMISAGVFHPEVRVELIDGEMLEMTPQGSRHVTAVRLIEDALRAACAQGYDVRVQMPLAIDLDSEPEPDVAVVGGNPRDYRDAHPSTAVLVVEVADSSLSFDRERKKNMYGRNGIPEYWILNLVNGCLEVYRNPSEGFYQSMVVLHSHETVSPLFLHGKDIGISELLP